MTTETAASEKQLRSNQALAQDSRLQYLFIGLGKIQSTIGLSGLVILSTGIVVALLCTVWAIEARVPYPVAIMAGYCTLVGSACLCAAILVVQNLSDKKIQTNTKRQPNYAAWDLVATLGSTLPTSSLSMRKNSSAYVAWMLAGTATLSVRADPI